MATKDRSQQGLRDMVLSLGALLLIIGSLLVFNRGCSFSPGTPEADPATAPTVDAAGDLKRYARSTEFPLRYPELPQAWRANSSSSGTNPDIVRVGWITPGKFVQLSQSNAKPIDVLRAELGQHDVVQKGTAAVGGKDWQVWPGRRDEQAWTVTVDGVTFVITGSGTQDDFRTMATAVLAATALPR